MSFGYRPFFLASITLGSIVAGCSSGADDGKKVDTSCAAVCKRITAPKCEKTETDCIATCEEESRSTPAICKSKLNALTACFAQATFHCDEDGVPTADGCKPELTAWSSCLRENPGDEPGNEEPNVCAPSTGDDACESCGKASCCDELSACGVNSDCMKLLDCFDGCTDQACLEACFSKYPKAQAAMTALAECTVNECPVCTDD